MCSLFRSMEVSPSPAQDHKAGFVSIVGKPNAGKSTLMNQLVGERLSVITSKAQTTRHRIFGIVSGENFQIVYSDTPGIISKPQYKLHETMVKFVYASLEDADLVLYMIDAADGKTDEGLERRLVESGLPVLALINKVDLVSKDAVEALKIHLQAALPQARIMPISALKNIGVEQLLPLMLEHLPFHPAYYDKEELTDRSERFFAAEIIRGHILQLYKQEIPYSCEVIVNEFKEKTDLLIIRADIYVERPTQKSIIIGTGGDALKKLGVASRKDLEVFFGQKVFLETRVKVEPDWRNKPHKLTHFGYSN